MSDRHRGDSVAVARWDDGVEWGLRLADRSVHIDGIPLPPSRTAQALSSAISRVTADDSWCTVAEEPVDLGGEELGIGTDSHVPLARQRNDGG